MPDRRRQHDRSQSGSAGRGGRPDAPHGGRRSNSRSRPSSGRGVRPVPAKPAGGTDDSGGERLQKVLAAAGIGSRRACEELITAGRVEVDRSVVTTLGTRVDVARQEIRVDGERLPDPSRVVYMLYKPVGVVTTHFDPSGRPRVIDMVPGERRLFPIGRLDRMSEGLILVTNDGGLANRLAHPRYGVEKRYHVQVAGRPSPETLDRLRQGVSLAEGLARVQRVTIRSQHRDSSVLDMVLDEGKNREIRRMLAKMGHKVHQLKRVAIGSLSLGNLLPGEHRRLAWEEVERLREETVAAPVREGARTDSPRPTGRPRPGSRGRRPSAPRESGTARDGDRRRQNTREARGRPGGRGTTAPRNRDRQQSVDASTVTRPHPRKRRRAGRASQWRKASGGPAREPDGGDAPRGGRSA